MFIFVSILIRFTKKNHKEQHHPKDFVCLNKLQQMMEIYLLLLMDLTWITMISGNNIVMQEKMNKKVIFILLGLENSED